MTTRNVLKFGAVLTLCVVGGLAVPFVRIAGPAGLDLANPKQIVASGSRGAYFRHKQWLADIKTLVSAVHFWFEPERPLTPVRIPAFRSGASSAQALAANAGPPPAGGILSTSAPSSFDSPPVPLGGSVGSPFDGMERVDKFRAGSANALGAMPNG